MNIILFKKGINSFSKNDDRYQHIKKVLKLKVLDTFRCGVINESEGKATIVSFTDEEISFTYEKERDSSPLFDVTLILSEVRPICMKRILREVASLGIKELRLFISDLSDKSYSGATLYKSGEAEQILLNGAMQSGKSSVTNLVRCSSLEEAMNVNTEEKIILDNVVGSISFNELDLENKRVSLAIGGERGFTNKERDLLINSNFAPVIMGDRILRTESAVVSAISLSLLKMKKW